MTEKSPSQASARLWLGEGVRDEKLSPELAARIMRVIDDPDIISNLEKESELLKTQILNRLR